MLLEMIKQTIEGTMDNMSDTGAVHWFSEQTKDEEDAQHLYDSQISLLEMMLKCLEVPKKEDALKFVKNLAGNQWEMIEWHLLEGTYLDIPELAASVGQEVKG